MATDVQVKVEHALPGFDAAAVQEVYTIRPEPVPSPSGYLLRELNARCKVFGGDVEQVGRVGARHHKGMAMAHRVDVHERDRPFALSDRRR